MPSLERCPLFRASFIERFHCFNTKAPNLDDVVAAHATALNCTVTFLSIHVAKI